MKRCLLFTATSLFILTLYTAAQTAPPKHPLIILIGPPLSGKTMYADSMAKTYAMPVISIEYLIKDHAAELGAALIEAREQGTRAQCCNFPICRIVAARKCV